MNHYKKLEVAINTVQNTCLSDEEGFFVKDLAPKLMAVINLMHFSNIQHTAFNEYLGWFQNDIQLDIKRCSEVSVETSDEEKKELLEIIKKHVHAKLKVVDFAFIYFLKDKSLLFQEEKPRSISSVNEWPTELYPSYIKYSNS
jgi:hypothetical protein